MPTDQNDRQPRVQDGEDQANGGASQGFDPVRPREPDPMGLGPEFQRDNLRKETPDATPSEGEVRDSEDAGRLTPPTGKDAPDWPDDLVFPATKKDDPL